MDEPNKGEFEHGGLKCLILRHGELGHLCGYVAVPKGHPCYGRHYNCMPYDDLFPVGVHGGLTFASEGDGDRWPEGYWWLGFDCAHAYDLVPFIEDITKHYGTFHGDTYRNFQYVRREAVSLADQMAKLEFIDWQFTWVWPFLLPITTAWWIWRSRSRKRAIFRG